MRFPETSFPPTPEALAAEIWCLDSWQQATLIQELCRLMNTTVNANPAMQAHYVAKALRYGQIFTRCCVEDFTVALKGEENE